MLVGRTLDNNRAPDAAASRPPSQLATSEWTRCEGLVGAEKEGVRNRSDWASSEPLNVL
jgi:predicted nucleic acid-binding protein